MLRRALCALACAPLAQAAFELTVQRPNQLINSFPYGIVSPDRFGNCPSSIPPADCKTGSPALFGIPEYGVPIQGQLVYATPGDLDGCTPLDRNAPGANWPARGGPVIVLLDRGNCTFVTKVYNAQVAGATAAIIVDNRDEARKPFMADDGTGGRVRIPSILIDLADGQIFKDWISTNATAQGDPFVTLTYELPNPDNHVEWDFFTTVGDARAMQFKRVFKAAVAALGNNASMTPHYAVEKWDICELPEQPCGTQCTNFGRYCTRDSDQGVPGAQVLEESIRQICIWRALNASGDQTTWWDYVSQYDSKCLNTTAFGEACSNEIIANLTAINAATVRQCVSAAGGTTDDVPNTILEGEVNAFVDAGVFVLPTVYINNAPYRGGLNCPEPLRNDQCGVLSGICDGFIPVSYPKACLTEPGCPMGQVKDECNVCGGDGKWDSCGKCLSQSSPLFNKTCNASSGLSALQITLLVLGVVAVISIGVFLYMKRQQRVLRDDIDTLLNRYLPLDAANAQTHPDTSGLLGAEQQSDH